MVRRKRRKSGAEETVTKSVFKPAPSKDYRKNAQLCAQVADALSLALAQTHDPRLWDLWVVEVRPAPNVSHLEVLLQSERDEGEVDSVREKLQLRYGFFRGAVSEAIHRKKVPSFHFVVLPQTAQENRSKGS